MTPPITKTTDITAALAQVGEELDAIAGIAPGYGNVCELIARRARKALTTLSSIIEGLKEREADAQDGSVRAALKRLVDLKAHKDAHEKNNWYLKNQKDAWEQASAALNRQPAEAPPLVRAEISEGRAVEVILAVIAPYLIPGSSWTIASCAFRALQSIATISPKGEASDLSGWQPIETAPKGDIWILGYGIHESDGGIPAEASVCPIMFYDGQEWLNITYYPSHPTHWMPLPKPPTITEKE